MEALKDQDLDPTTAWDFIDLCAANLSEPGIRSASFDGLWDALITGGRHQEPEHRGGPLRLRETDLDKIREIVRKNTV